VEALTAYTPFVFPPPPFAPDRCYGHLPRLRADARAGEAGQWLALELAFLYRPALNGCGRQEPPYVR